MYDFVAFLRTNMRRKQNILLRPTPPLHDWSKSLTDCLLRKTFNSLQRSIHFLTITDRFML